MPIVEIHGKKVHIPEGSHSAEHAVRFLEKNQENAKAFFDAAKRNLRDGVAHFETNRPGGYSGSTNFTLIHHSNGEYELRKKEHHLL